MNRALASYTMFSNFILRRGVKILTSLWHCARCPPPRYPFGIPFTYYFILRKYKDAICPPGLSAQEGIAKRSGDAELKPFRFLFKYYLPRSMYFEIFDAIRRMVLGVMLGFIGSSAVRAMWGSALALVGIMVQREQMPYPDKATNYLHYWAQWQLYFTFIAGLIISGKPFAYSESGLGFSLLIFNMSTPMLAVFMHVLGWKQKWGSSAKVMAEGA